MSLITLFSYDINSVKRIKDWGYGSNWPVVYIIYNDKNAYVGETIDAVRRTEQHLQEKEFDEFKQICLITNRTFNKSATLDLESFLIKYISADGTKRLTNGNAGVVNHNYFYKEAYEEDFRDIWSRLIDFGIVNNSLFDIENSELFKYSPYKSLNLEQQKATYQIISSLSKINNASIKSIIMVTGGAGTGKTILAVYLIKLLKDILDNKKVWAIVEDVEDAAFIEKASKKLADIKKIGFVVPMRQLRTTIKSVFNTIDGLSDSMVLAPEEVVKDYYDVLVVDEAHRLYRRKHLPGQHMYKKFDSINKELMGESLTRTENDLTELDWILRSSRMQVVFYDSYQTIRATDIGPERVSAICKPHLYHSTELFSQMRCKGGNGYYEYVRRIIEDKNCTVYDYKKIDDYELHVYDNIEDLFSMIRIKRQLDMLCEVVTGPGWSMEEAIIIDGKEYCWSKGKNSDQRDTILSVHKIQGFDLNYAGVIFGKEVYYDTKDKCIAINRKELKDPFTKSNGIDNMRRFVLNIYITLMTRGINGTYVYAVDKELRAYLEKFFN